MDKAEVIVGNIGSVYCGESLREARLTFNIYLDHSKDDHGRCAGESVTLIWNGEILAEYPGT